MSEIEPLTVVSVAYPFAPVDEDPVGGAEQVLSKLDQGLVAAGHRSIIVAQEGSRAAGRLRPIPRLAGDVDETARAQARRAIAEAVAEIRRAQTVDVIHFHGVDFHEHLPPPGPPVLATLHLPLDWYPRPALRPERPDTWLNPVSADQAARAPAGAQLLAPIENGVELDHYPHGEPKRGFALALGRICPEKGLHLALDACAAAGVDLLLAGEVFPYPAHRAYFETEIAPRLGPRACWIGPVRGVAKRRLLAAARCLLIPSLAPETSSLVAREALAAGTPVVAFKNGALTQAIEPGRTGFLVDDVEGMAERLGDVGALEPEACRQAARARFSADRMVAEYLALYRALANRAPSALMGAAAC